MSAGEGTGPLVDRGDPSRSSQPPEVPLKTQSATITISHPVTVAGGVFAPGHLRELTQYLPFELVDDVLEQTRTVQRRLRLLPSRAGVYQLPGRRCAAPGSAVPSHGAGVTSADNGGSARSARL